MFLPEGLEGREASSPRESRGRRVREPYVVHVTRRRISETALLFDEVPKNMASLDD